MAVVMKHGETFVYLLLCDSVVTRGESGGGGEWRQLYLNVNKEGKEH